MIEHQFAQEATVKAVEGDSAVLALANGETLRWPASLLPQDVGVGDTVRVIIHSSKTDEEERQRLAKEVLNELLNAN